MADLTKAILSICGHYARQFCCRSRATAWTDVAASKEVLSSARYVPAVHPYFEEANLAIIPTVVHSRYWERTRTAVTNALTAPDTYLHESAVYTLRHAVLHRGTVLCQSMHHDLRVPPRFGLPLKCQRLHHGVLAHTYFSSRYWGHWLSNELPMQLSLHARGDLVGYQPRRPYRDEDFWRRIIGLPPIHQAETWYLDELLVSDSIGYDADSVRQFHRIRSIVQQKPKAFDRVFLLRGGSSTDRVLHNERQLAVRLEREGFHCLEVGASDGEEIVNAMCGASIVLGTEGSHLAPFMYTMADRGLLVVLQPPRYVGLNQNDYASFCGLPSAVYICNPTQTGDSFEVDADDLLRFMDRATRWAGTAGERFARFSTSITA